MYEYKCSSCKAAYDRLKPMAQRDEEACKECGEPAARQQSVTGGMIRGKGSWSSPAPRTAGPAPAGGTMRRTQSRGIANNMTPAEINSLPVVGRDGKLYSADGKKDITPGGPS